MVKQGGAGEEKNSIRMREGGCSAEAGVAHKSPLNETGPEPLLAFFDVTILIIL